MAASPSAHLLAPLLGEGAPQLECIADVKLAGGQGYYRLNDDKVGRTGCVRRHTPPCVALLAWCRRRRPAARHALCMLSARRLASCDLPPSMPSLLPPCPGAGLAAAQGGAGQGRAAGRL